MGQLSQLIPVLPAGKTESTVLPSANGFPERPLSKDPQTPPKSQLLPSKHTSEMVPFSSTSRSPFCFLNSSGDPKEAPRAPKAPAAALELPLAAAVGARAWLRHPGRQEPGQEVPSSPLKQGLKQPPGVGARVEGGLWPPSERESPAASQVKRLLAGGRRAGLGARRAPLSWKGEESWADVCGEDELHQHRAERWPHRVWREPSGSGR